MTNYEQKVENQQEIPLPARRTEEEKEILEFLKLREEVEAHYKKIREAKKRIEELVEKNKAVADLDRLVRKRPREIEQEKQEKKKKRAQTIDEATAEEEKEKKKKIKNARKKKIDTHRSYIQQGYTMTPGEIAEEGGEKYYSQYVYFKDLGEGKSSTHIMKGLVGLKLSSDLGVEEMELSAS